MRYQLFFSESNVFFHNRRFTAIMFSVQRFDGSGSNNTGQGTKGSGVADRIALINQRKAAIYTT